MAPFQGRGLEKSIELWQISWRVAHSGFYVDPRKVKRKTPCDARGYHAEISITWIGKESHEKWQWKGGGRPR